MKNENETYEKIIMPSFDEEVIMENTICKEIIGF